MNKQITGKICCKEKKKWDGAKRGGRVKKKLFFFNCDKTCILKFHFKHF